MAEIGEPLPTLTPAQRERFDLGRFQFARIFAESDGLGPRFNENACNACHTDPVDGGTGEQLVVRASIQLDSLTCDPLLEQGGNNLRRRVTSLGRTSGMEAQPLPASSTHGGRFQVPFLFGGGALEAVPEDVLNGLADPEDRDGDGISGRRGRDHAGRPARFGRKADVADLRAFTDEAFRFEMGLTTPVTQDERMAGISADPRDLGDAIAEPEVAPAEFDAVLDFLRFLAPPTPSMQESAAVERGAELFGELGCARCHVPSLPLTDTGEGVFEGYRARVYTDLLLHDMGPGLAGPCSVGAHAQEYRTEPLMGLRYRSRFLHDGRALSVRDAILAHGGEAGPARARFEGLDRRVQEWLVEFLGTL